MTHRILIIGFGSIGQRHLDTLLDLGYRDVVGIDPRPGIQEDRIVVLATFPHVSDWTKEQFTHALICSPPTTHFEHAKWCLNRGVRVFIEKPMTMTISEARTLCAIAHMNKQPIAIGYQERAHPVVQQAKAWVADHRPTNAMVVCNWRATEKTYPLDVLAESSHAIDTALYLFGKPDAVKQFKAKTSATCKFSWQDGREVTVAMNMQADHVHRAIHMTGKDGKTFHWPYGRNSKEWDACYRMELQAFLEGKPLCTGDDGLAVMEVMEGRDGY